MILFQGKVYDGMLQGELLGQLEDRINRTRMGRPPGQETVIRALGRLGQELRDEIAGGGSETQISLPAVFRTLSGARQLLRFCSREWLEYRIETELGCNPPPAFAKEANAAESRILPLGTLFHITAGNVDGLPIFSIAEGLLTGNVNILKLPGSDHGLSFDMILRLIRLEPELADYIYIFDTPSHDLDAMKRLAETADGIVVWGGDEAVSAVRRLAPPGTRLIEWGHKLGFAYISGYDHKEEELSSLAEHILTTRQLLCSSCQTIFLDTESMEDVTKFCNEFLPYMERAVFAEDPSGERARAALALERCSDRLEQAVYGKKENRKLFLGQGCSLIACEDHKLELSPMFGNCLVKRLPAGQIIRCLRGQKAYLQTAGLICGPDRRSGLTDILAASGVSRITRAGTMSSVFAGEGHDGEYALRRYVRVVNVER